MKSRNFKHALWLLIIAILTSSIIQTAFLARKSSAMEPGLGEGYATIYVSPMPINLTSPPYHVGDKFSAEIRITNYSQVAGWQLKLVYDKSLINASSIDDVFIATDHVFPDERNYTSPPVSIGAFNTTHQYIMKVAVTFGAIEYNGSDAGLLEINFTIMAEPAPWETFSCVLWLEPVDTYTFDENIEENDETRIDGYYEIAGPRQSESGPGEGYATIYVFPTTVNLTSPPYRLNDKFSVEVRIHNYSLVAGWQVKLVYNKSLLQVSSVSDVAYPLSAGFLFPDGSYSYVSPSIADFNSTHQYVLMNASVQGAVGYNGTDAGLMVINFTVVSIPRKGETASCVLWLEPVDTYTFDENMEKNDETRIDGYFIIAVQKQDETTFPDAVIIAAAIVSIVAVVLALLLVKKRRKAFKKR